MDKTSDILIQAIKKQYLNSMDYNGLEISLLPKTGLNNEDIKDSIEELISNGMIGILSSSSTINPHINSYGFSDIEHQLTELRNNFSKCVLYPTPKILATKKSIKCTTPIEQYLRLGYPQLKAMFFDYDVLLTYALDPRYNFTFNDYRGSIISSDIVDERRYINLKSFGIGRNGEEIVIVAFPRYLRKMSPANQILWETHRIQDTSNCTVLKNYLDNELNGCWTFPNTVYRSILEEIENINALTEKIFKKEFFCRIYKKEELQGFDILPFPSMSIYNDFLLLLEKIVVSNINDKFFDSEIENIKTQDGSRKKSLNCLAEWLDKICPKAKNPICNPLKEVRKKRQIPAHKIVDNQFSLTLLNEQHKMCVSIYNSLYSLRILLMSHPLVKEVILPHNNTQYVEI